MRRALALCLLLPPLLAPLPALAGNQAQEQLADSVRSSLQASIADRAVPVLLFKSGAQNALPVALRDVQAPASRAFPTASSASSC